MRLQRIEGIRGKTSWTALLATAILAGCGGGSGSGGGTLGVTESNAESVASAAFEAGQGVMDAGGSGDVFSARTPGSSGLRFDLTSFVRGRLADLLPSDVRSVIVTETTQCPGGGEITENWNDADDSGDTSTGDTFELLITDCVEDGETVSGRIFIDNLVLEANQNQVSIAIRMTVDQLTITDGTDTITLDGQVSAALTLSNSTIFFQYTLNATFDGGGLSILGGTTIALTVDLNTDTFSYTTSGGVEVPTFGGTVTFETTVPFTGNTSDEYPSTGTLLVRGANNTSLRLTAIDNVQVSIEVDADGDGQYETTITTNWAALDN